MRLFWQEFLKTIYNFKASNYSLFMKIYNRMGFPKNYVLKESRRESKRHVDEKYNER